MSEKFQLVLYYTKRVVVGGKPSIDTLISVKKKVSNLDTNNSDEMDALLDEYSKNKQDVGREEEVETFALVYDDDNFIDNIINIEQSEEFIDWEESSKEIIKQKIVNN